MVHSNNADRLKLSSTIMDFVISPPLLVKFF